MTGRTPLLLMIAATLACSRQPTLPAPTVENFSYARPQEVGVTHMDLDLKVDFDQQVITGRAAYDLDKQTDARAVVFDTWALRITDVTLEGGKPTHWTLGDSLPLIGRPLSVAIGPEDARVIVHYRTTSEARGLQWLSPAQTAGKQLPYMYSQSQSVHARSWVPCQDTPSERFTYNARVEVPPGLMALMSARNPKNKTADGVYNFEMNQPLPSYLLALAVGDIEYRAVGERCGVYSEPGVVEKAAWEFADMERMITTAEQMYGPYRWEQFDVLVLPPSFPFGGMENPRLTFLTPVLVAGDRSLVSVVCHELAHSWSGNLVTNRTWDDFWLNEGFTTYFERRLDEVLYGREYMEMQALLGVRDLDLEFEEVGADNPHTALYFDLAGADPDEATNNVPYEKGYLFLRLLEESFGRETFDGFLRQYFESHAFQTMTTQEFLAYMKRELFKGDEELYASLQVDTWVYGAGLPDNAPQPRSTRFDDVDAQMAAFVNGTPAAKLNTDGWTTNEWQRFLDNLPQPLPAARLADLENTYHMNTANAVVQRSWFPNVIAAGWQPGYPAIEKFLMTIGRRYLLRPVYMKLAETPDGMTFARGVYTNARPGYHSITANGIDEVLGWSETGGGAGK
ncbi:MAG: M1 family metallopeptidase [Candidatus Krumholzibacteria bacterium]|nr:M1 family metallopeptidase [Candidatus Krumholzibacteria bacterium]MDH4336840.1 M1 family metallopeptidase [Candidatus Krumholzibacteria bacterium]MDH5269171.1 M1 family metallopeptidase [Candidatus Krumholzibacteria bacterium]